MLHLEVVVDVCFCVGVVSATYTVLLVVIFLSILLSHFCGVGFTLYVGLVLSRGGSTDHKGHQLWYVVSAKKVHSERHRTGKINCKCAKSDVSKMGRSKNNCNHKLEAHRIVTTKSEEHKTGSA